MQPRPGQKYPFSKSIFLIFCYLLLTCNSVVQFLNETWWVHRVKHEPFFTVKNVFIFDIGNRLFYIKPSFGQLVLGKQQSNILLHKKIFLFHHLNVIYNDRTNLPTLGNKTIKSNLTVLFQLASANRKICFVCPLIIQL